MSSERIPESKKYICHLKPAHRPDPHGDDAGLAAILADHRPALDRTRYGVIIRGLARRYWNNWKASRPHIEDMICAALGKAVRQPQGTPDRVVRNRLQTCMESELNDLRSLAAPCLRENWDLVREQGSPTYLAEPGWDSLVDFDPEHSRALARSDALWLEREALEQVREQPAQRGARSLTAAIRQALLGPVPACTLPRLSDRQIKDKRAHEVRHAYGQPTRFMSVIEFADGQQPCASYRYHSTIEAALSHLDRHRPDYDSETYRPPIGTRGGRKKGYLDPADIEALATEFSVSKATIRAHVKALEERILEHS